MTRVARNPTLRLCTTNGADAVCLVLLEGCNSDLVPHGWPCVMARICEVVICIVSLPFSAEGAKNANVACQRVTGTGIRSIRNHVVLCPT